MIHTAQITLPSPLTEKPLVIKKRHEDILQAIRDLRFVTNTDMQKLFFTYPSESKHAAKLLSALAGGHDYGDRQYLFRFPLPDTRIGNTTKIYTLGALGVAYVKRVLRMDINWSFSPYKLRHMHYYPCLHALTLTRFLVETQVYCRTQPDLRIAKFVTQYDLPRLSKEKARVNNAKGGNDEPFISPIPDAWIDFEWVNEDGTHNRFVPVLLEIDRATEYQKSFKTHLAARLAFIKPNGAYKDLFGTNSARIAYVTTGGSERLRHMMHWTKDVLTEQHKQHLQHLFYFCSLPYGEFDGKVLLQAPSWYRLNAKFPISLIS